jgi:Fur family ferric uptake transcriptional regulator
MSPSASKPSPLLAAALARLSDAGQRRTGPRCAILKIITAEHGPFGVDELHRRLHGEMDLVTVYRCLAALEQLDMVRRCDFGDGIARYEYVVPGHHHHHVICRLCRRVETLDVCVAERLERAAASMGYAEITHSMEVFGICANCQKRR